MRIEFSDPTSVLYRSFTLCQSLSSKGLVALINLQITRTFVGASADSTWSASYLSSWCALNPCMNNITLNWLWCKQKYSPYSVNLFATTFYAALNNIMIRYQQQRSYGARHFRMLWILDTPCCVQLGKRSSLSWSQTAEVVYWTK